MGSGVVVWVGGTVTAFDTGAGAGDGVALGFAAGVGAVLVGRCAGVSAGCATVVGELTRW
jgi:hypothetical protein